MIILILIGKIWDNLKMHGNFLKPLLLLYHSVASSLYYFSIRKVVKRNTLQIRNSGMYLKIFDKKKNKNAGPSNSREVRLFYWLSSLRDLKSN